MWRSVKQVDSGKRRCCRERVWIERKIAESLVDTKTGVLGVRPANLTLLRSNRRVSDDTSRVSFDKRIGRGTKRGCIAAESCFLAQAQLQAIACNLQLLDSGEAMPDRPISAARCHARI